MKKKNGLMLIMVFVIGVYGCSLAADYWEIKDVYVSVVGQTLTYGFAGPNALDAALSAYCDKMGIPSVSSSDIPNRWIPNSNLDSNVKKAMTEGSYDYSFACYVQSGYLILSINHKQCNEYQYNEIAWSLH